MVLPTPFPTHSHVRDKVTCRQDRIFPGTQTRRHWQASIFLMTRGGPLISPAVAFAIYVTSEITSAANCYKFGPPGSDEEVSSESIHGVRYSHLRESSIPPEEIDFYHAFENGRCYEIAMDFGFYRTGGYDLGCAIPVMDPNSLTKLVLPQISFFKP
jgi:hypothetical protein